MLVSRGSPFSGMIFNVPDTHRTSSANGTGSTRAAEREQRHSNADIVSQAPFRSVRTTHPTTESFNKRIPSTAFGVRHAPRLDPHPTRCPCRRPVGDAYVDLNATDPGLPTCVKHLLAAGPPFARPR